MGEPIFRDLSEVPPETTAKEICDNVRKILAEYGVQIIRTEPVPKPEEYKEDFR